MKILLNKLKINYFKGIKALDVSFTFNTNIYNDNATGKTSVMDAFLWLLFGKESTDRTAFEVKHISQNGNGSPKDVEVEGDLLVDDQPITLKRIFREKWVKKRGSATSEFSGHETILFYNEVSDKQIASGNREFERLHNECEALVIEAGVSLLQVKKALDFQLGLIKGCVVTHRHRDHAKYVREYADVGIDVLAPADVFKGHQRHHRLRDAISGKGCTLERFKIIPFKVAHDVPCYGYLVDHPDTGRILFLTDTYLCEYSFPDLSHIIIEANYADDILKENIFRGIEHPSKRERLLTSHMVLETSKAVLMAQDLSGVHNIILTHLSDRNSDESRFMDDIKALTGKPVCAAKPGMTLRLTKKTF